MIDLRKLPLLLPAIGWASGIALARTDLVPATTVPVVLIMAMIVAIVTSKSRALALALIAGVIWGVLSLLLAAADVSVPDHWLESTTDTTARVEKLDHDHAYTRLQLTQLKDDSGGALTGKALLYVYRLPEWIGVGQMIRFQARWHTPRNHQNPGGFDYESYCFDRGIALIGSLRGKATLIAESPSWLESSRAMISHAMAEVPQDERGVIRALLLGDRVDIPVHINDYFAASGAAHLLAISGLHVGMVSALFFFLCRFMMSRREAWIVRFPIQKYALIIGAIGAILYATMAGWPLPAQRAALMLAAAAIAWVFRSRNMPINTMFMALMLILLLDPASISSVSLWLSFLATSSLLLWASEQQGGTTWGRVKAMLWITFLASLATLPLILTVFGRIPVYTLLANLLLLPLYSLIVLPSALLAEFFAVIGALEFAQVIFSWSGSAISIGHRLLATFYAWPGGNLWVVPPATWMTWLYVAGISVAILLLKQKKRRAAIATVLSTLLLYLLLVLPEHPPSGYQLIVWDVGQGAASTLLFPEGKVLAVDLPGKPKSRYNGGTTVAAGLRHLGLTHVDYLALSHAQHDHMGGASRLIEQVNHVGELWMADTPTMRSHPEMKKIMAKVQEGDGKLRWLKQGDRFRVNGIDVNVLWPPQGFHSANSNNGSLVLSIQLPSQQRLLFPGDVELQSELAMISPTMISNMPNKHAITLIPHHGSLTSSHPSWVKHVSPDIAIAQAGFRNRYGFPKERVLDRYRAVGSDILNTADGAVTVSLELPGAALKGEYHDGAHHTRHHLAALWWQWL